MGKINDAVGLSGKLHGIGVDRIVIPLFGIDIKASDYLDLCVSAAKAGDDLAHFSVAAGNDHFGHRM
jgi:hypothetical protein